MKKFNLGTYGESELFPGNGKFFHVDLEALLKSRLLVQANSGGGKTHLLRKLLEVTNGHVQQVVLDIEGEFSSLREKYDYVLIGSGGDNISADPRHAEMLAKKVLELEVDVIINLYELKHHDRILFVKRFLDAMVNAPKDLWHKCLVILDEAHIFAPEKSKAESLNAVIDMESRGRKRGFCLVPATQRPAKLHKDVAAECGNKLIGVANMDIDRARAAGELGFNDKERILGLRDLEPGEFFAVGPAFPKGVNLVQIGDTQTKSYEFGKKTKRNIPQTKRVKQLLSKLTDLPQEAEEEQKSVQALQLKIKELQRELKSQKPVVETKVEKIVDKKVLTNLLNDFHVKVRDTIKSENERSQKTINKLFTDLDIKKLSGSLVFSPMPSQKILDLKPLAEKAIKVFAGTKVKSDLRTERQQNISELGKCEKAILKFLSIQPMRSFSKAQVGAMTGYAPTSGSFNNSVSKLRTANLINCVGSQLSASMLAINEIQEILGSEFQEADSQALVRWLDKLGKCEKEIYRVLLDNPAEVFSKERIGEITSYAPTSGSFNNAISRLNTLGLIKKVDTNQLQLNPELTDV